MTGVSTFFLPHFTMQYGSAPTGREEGGREVGREGGREGGDTSHAVVCVSSIQQHIQTHCSPSS